MATRSHIYVKTDTGYLGCYCHYDGYPENMVPALSVIPYKELYAYILRGMIGGGFNSMRPGQPPEYIVTEEPCILHDPNCSEESTYVSYVYVVNQDGAIAYRSANEREWLSDIEHLYENDVPDPLL